MTIQINTDQFFDTYKPITNQFDSNASWGGCMFETYGEELEFVMAQDPNHIWTIVDGEDDVEITNGYHLVNRIGYFVSEVASPDDFVLVRDEDESDPSIEEMRDAIVEDAFDTCLTDSDYLKSILQDYFSDISEEMIRKNYADMRDTD